MPRSGVTYGGSLVCHSMCFTLRAAAGHLSVFIVQIVGARGGVFGFLGYLVGDVCDGVRG